MARTAPTRDRLLDAALDLIAEHGYKAATVGAIEKKAGLAPRSGALYQHFDGKEALLEAAIERELAAIDELPSVMEMLPLGDLRAELTLLARWNLASLDRRARLIALVQREGPRLPKRLRTKLYQRLVEQPYELIVEWLRAKDGDGTLDHHALAIVLAESMASYRTLRRTFDKTPGDVDDDRLIDTWVDLCLAFAAQRGFG